MSVDVYDSTAPGEPVESVDVFEDQLSSYGVWVDEPSIGHVFIPEQNGFVPYTNGHWQYTSVGFVWISDEPFAWATSHYGRWAFSQPYSRWVWLPDTEWGPAWVEWRQTSDHFGWAPLAPTIVINAGYSAPTESWHYCASAHVLDVDLHRYYEPRDRVVVIHREARPIEHYATISRVRVAVGPPAVTLRERRIAVRPVKVEARVVGRVTATEAHAQVTRAHERKVVVEEQNRKKIAANVTIKKVVEQHPVRAQAKVEVKPEPKREEPKRVEPKREEPKRVEPKREEPKRVEPKVETKRVEQPKAEPKVEPKRVEPKVETKRVEQPKAEPKHEQPKIEPKHVETPKAEPKHVEQPKAEPKIEPKHVETPKAEPKRVEQPKAEPKVEPKRVEIKPEPKRVEAKSEPKHEAKADPKKPEPKNDH